MGLEIFSVSGFYAFKLDDIDDENKIKMCIDQVVELYYKTLTNSLYKPYSVFFTNNYCIIDFRNMNLTKKMIDNIVENINDCRINKTRKM